MLIVGPRCLKPCILLDVVVNKSTPGEKLGCSALTLSRKKKASPRDLQDFSEWRFGVYTSNRKEAKKKKSQRSAEQQVLPTYCNQLELLVFLYFTIVVLNSVYIIYLVCRFWGCRAERGSHWPWNLAVWVEEETDQPDLTSALGSVLNKKGCHMSPLEQGCVSPAYHCVFQSPSNAWHVSVMLQTGSVRAGMLWECRREASNLEGGALRRKAQGEETENRWIHRRQWCKKWGWPVRLGLVNKGLTGHIEEFGFSFLQK